MGEAKTIAVIGGGASGLAAAVAAGEALRDLEGAAGAAGEYNLFHRLQKADHF